MKHLISLVVVAFIAVVGVSAQNAPRVLNNPDPVYPPVAAEIGYGGTVKVNIKVDKRGKVKVLDAWGPVAPCSDLNDPRARKIREAVVEAANKVEFEPPVQDGKPAEIEMTVSYSFDAAGHCSVA